MEWYGTKCRRKGHRRFRLHALSIYPFCQWCALPLTEGNATTDHLIPLSRGGTNDWGNLCLACEPCNLARKNDMPERSPLGPSWGEAIVPIPYETATPSWVVWTRYPGGRWRSTFRGESQERLIMLVNTLMGKVVESVILLDGQFP
jgi:hypothetical protein